MKRFVIALILMTISTLIGFGIGAGWFSERPDRVAQLERNLESHRHRRATEDKYDVRVAGAAADFKAGTYPWTMRFFISSTSPSIRSATATPNGRP